MCIVELFWFDNTVLSFMVKYNQLQYFDPDYGNSISNNADTRFSTEAKCAMGTLNRKHNCHTAPSRVYLLLTDLGMFRFML